MSYSALFEYEANLTALCGVEVLQFGCRYRVLYLVLEWERCYIEPYKAASQTLVASGRKSEALSMISVNINISIYQDNGNCMGSL